MVQAPDRIALWQCRGVQSGQRAGSDFHAAAAARSTAPGCWKLAQESLEFLFFGRKGYWLR